MLSINSIATAKLRQLPWRAIGRWWVVGLSFFAIGIPILYLLIDVLKLRLIWGTLLAAEVTTILRYGINDRWVFGELRPTWKRFWQFHVANAGGFVIWYSSVNLLPTLGVHYLIASVVGTGTSVFMSMATNF